MGQPMLRITFQRDAETTVVILEGRITGLWTAELRRVWTELAPTLGTRQLSVDMRNTTYADASGIQVLRDMYLQSGAELIASTPWTKHLANEITRETEAD